VHNIHSILKQYWGFDSFRPLQEDIIHSVLAGNDTLALLPTGGGKSICFQVPGMAIDGMCLVISPLIALMKDQVQNLNSKGIKATAIYSGLQSRTIDALLDNCMLGKVKFLYISPERLATDDFRARMQRMNIRLLVVDEAHCISQWGYDFRPPYLQIAGVRTALGNVPVIALTATATPDVVKDIQEKLQFKKPNVFSKSFVRANLSYVVRQTLDKEKALLDILSKVKGSAVVYVRNRKRTRQYAELLNKHNIKADYYHAGLEPNERSRKQEAWIKNKTRVICCTNAFGMGIDKPDVRSVIHMDLADSPEAYFQEAGRAGRDEQKAYAVQLCTGDDVTDLDEKLNDGFPTIDFIRQVYEDVMQHLVVALHDGMEKSYEWDLSAFSRSRNYNPAKVDSALKILEQQQVLYVSENAYSVSQIKCISSKEALSLFQQQHKKLEPVVKMVLRTSEGVFEDFVAVDEDAMALRLKLTADEVMQQLTQLHGYKIFSYIPRRNKPRITLLQNRVKKDELRLDRDFINRRKADYEKRLKALRRYITDNTVCRTRQLVSYFGETTAADCGICDVCVDKKKNTTADFYTIAKAVENVLQQNALTVAELGKAVAINTANLQPVLDFLIDKGNLTTTPDGKLKWL
jgi:ATP-dependent DNA helicase RecQ